MASSRANIVAITSNTTDSIARAEAQWKSAIESLGLSPQHRWLVALVLEGKTDKEIAAVMAISENTVRSYLNRIFIRLGVRNRMALAMHVFARSLKLTPNSLPLK